MVPTATGPLRFTVPLTVLPPAIAPVRLMPEIAGAMTVTWAVLVPAVKVTGVIAVTGIV